ncbi:hypothetical protein QL285_076974 [Trifolium repens]|nr:hypothetical protein QL285_076974 [Trifolium repens]
MSPIFLPTSSSRLVTVEVSSSFSWRSALIIFLCFSVNVQAFSHSVSKSLYASAISSSVKTHTLFATSRSLSSSKSVQEFDNSFFCFFKNVGHSAPM